MKLGLITTAYCNAACDHCSTSCGPTRSETLPRDKVMSLMDEAAALSKASGKPLKFGFSGGEPFLEFDTLLQLIAHGKKTLGAEEVTCVSNGYWATSPEKARSHLSAVKEAGLDILAISSSRFHRAFIKTVRVERALNAARDVGLHCVLKFVHTESDVEQLDELEAWAFKAGATRIEILPILPHLRDGFSLPDSDYKREAGLPEGRCPTAIITVRESGTAYTCCTPGADTDFLSLGNVYDNSLQQIQDRFYLGSRQQLLRQHGPIHFARAAIAHGLGHKLRDRYHGACDLCAHIVSDPEMAAVATATAEAFELQQFQNILEQLSARRPVSRKRDAADPLPSTAVQTGDANSR